MMGLIRRHIINPLREMAKKVIRAVLITPLKTIKRKIYTLVDVHIVRRYMTLGEETRMRCKRHPEIKIRRTAVANKVYCQIKNIEKNREKDKKIRIVFICQFHAAWNACMSTFLAALNDPDIEVQILALPERVMQKGKSKRVSDITAEVYEEDNVAYKYCKSFYPKTINGYDPQGKKWFDLKAYKPDYVVISRSNQNYLPKQYRAETISTFTKVVHIPYAYCKMNWDSRAVYRENLTDYTYAVFTENNMYCDMLKQIYHETFGADWKKIEFFGYPRFDSYCVDNKQLKKDFQKTVLWLPRWVTEGRLESSTFFKYKDILIDFFLKHPEYKLICRPHPKMFGNFVATGEMTQQAVDEFKKLFAETPNLHLDEYSDYLPSFNEADIYISDTTSLLVEEFITGKPIVFCGIMSHFDADAKNWAQCMYPVRNKRQLTDRLISLLAENDPQESLREEYIKNEMKHDGKCGERIIEFLKRDCLGD